MSDIAARYDAFQAEAVQNILEDFRANRKGRFLLVIPTGGGKTKTAVKALSALFDGSVLSDSERVIWVVHRDELRTQATAALNGSPRLSNGAPLTQYVDVLMIGEIAPYLATHPEVTFAVIDEAHHGAAASYRPIFSRVEFGVLGLTATPSRHDAQPLPFDRESYSIGFPDLVRMGVLLQPHVEQVHGGRYDIRDTEDLSSLEVLNNDARNGRILEALQVLAPKLRKVLVYVGTKQHAKDLFALIRTTELAHGFDTLAIILGGERRRLLTATGEEYVQEDRQTFIAALKSAARALVVNVDVLTEGYDDPAVNAVVMARPTKSKLVYMQAIGRAVRLNPDQLDKHAYIVEVVDELPNIRYRIDNRWLYSDVSDLLEPAVVDRFYEEKRELRGLVEGVFDEFNVPGEYRALPEISDRDRVTLLLFKVFMGDGAHSHVPLVITNATRQAASNVFNFLSTKMKTVKDLDIETVFKSVVNHSRVFPALNSVQGRKRVFQAMQNAFELVGTPGEAIDAVRVGHPWITFLAFRLKLTTAGLPADLLAFTEDMYNKDSVREALSAEAISSEFALAKFPLPLKSYVGIFLSPSEMRETIRTIDALKVHASEHDGFKQWTLATTILGTATLSIEKRYTEALPTIVREDLDYYRWLAPRQQEEK